MKKYTFFMDMDETLIHNFGKPTETLLRIVREAQKEGHLFFVNTARAHGNVNPKNFPIECFDGLCSGSGTRIVYHGECIYENIIPQNEVYELVNTVLTAQPETKFVVESTRGLLLNAEDHWKPCIVMNYTSADDLIECYPDERIQKFASYHGYPIKSEVTDTFAHKFDVYQQPDYTEIVPVGYSKGKAIEIVEQKLGVPHESTVAMGDSMNDMPMMNYAAISIAMGNALDAVKAVATEITDTAENDGAAKAIAKLCGISYKRVLNDLNSSR